MGSLGASDASVASVANLAKPAVATVLECLGLPPARSSPCGLLDHQPSLEQHIAMKKGLDLPWSESFWSSWNALAL